MTVDHEQRAGQTPYQRLGGHFETFSQNGETSDSTRKLRLGDETDIYIGLDKSDELPEPAYGISVVTRQEREKDGDPDYFRFVISQTDKLNYIRVPRQIIKVGGISLGQTIEPQPRVDFTDPAISDALVGWLDAMLMENSYSVPPISTEIQA